LYLFQSTGLNTVRKGTTKIKLQSDVRLKMERLSADLRYAMEVLEVSPSSLKLTRFKPWGEEDAPGAADLVTVTYAVEQAKNRAVLTRAERGEAPQEILSADKIDPEVFFPYWEEINPLEGSFYHPFDLVDNDSDKRRMISYMRIRMKVQQNREIFTLVTSVCMRAAHARMLQPNWKFR
jgi:hypothetical protein